MIIDIHNKENLKLKSSRDVFLQCLIFISYTKKRNISNVYYELTRTSNIKDKDLNFIFHYLIKYNYLNFIKEQDLFLVTNEFNPEEIIEKLCSYYLSLILLNKDINMALFIASDFTIKNDSILINVDSIPFNYRPFLLVLQKLGLMEACEEKGVVLISNYTIAKKLLERPLRKISPEEFEKEQEQNKIYGIEAEKYVLDFEFNRLNRCKKIDWVAEYVVNKGYDIASYNSEIDEFPNRFIEVKSYNGDIPYFYWSRNEIDVAKRKLNEYWLYLVNRSEISLKEYRPKMIQNPIESVLNNSEWIKEVDKYKIILNV